MARTTFRDFLDSTNELLSPSNHGLKGYNGQFGSVCSAAGSLNFSSSTLQDSDRSGFEEKYGILDIYFGK